MPRKVKQAEAKHFIDPALLSATAHPVRAHCLMALFERVASPSELAEELDLPVQNVAYHVRELEKLGFIELVRVEKKRSAEHFFRVTKRHILDAETWGSADGVERAKITASILRQIGDDVSEALANRTIDDDDSHISRTPMIVDRLGWEEIAEELRGTLQRVLQIQTRSAGRRAAGDSDPADSIPIKVEILHFRSPSRG